MKITHCKLKKSIQRKLVEYFVLEVTARSAADLLDIHPNTAALYYKKIRLLITHHLEQEARKVFDGEVELDESYFGGVRKGKRGRGAGGKVAVFGLLKRGGHVYAKVVADTKTSTLMPIITDKIAPDSIVYTDSYRSYNALDVTDFHHHRINHSKLFANGHNHINGIENFWNQAKRVLRKYNGIPKESFPLFLKECEFRFNYGSPKQQLKQLRKWADI
jgi:transposase